MMNKKVKYLTASAVLSALMMSCSYKAVDYSTRTVSVHGTGSVSVEADNATITMAVVTRGLNVAVASNENAKIMSNVRKSVLELGLTKDCVTTENFTVYQDVNYVDGKQVPGDYKVTNKIKISVKDVELVSGIIDTALGAGANQLTSLQYGITDNELAIKQARTIAVQQAHEAAQLIAGTSGAKLGKILKIDEQPNFSNARNVSFMAKAIASDSYENESTPISSGKSTVTVSVDAIYELK